MFRVLRCDLLFFYHLQDIRREWCLSHDFIYVRIPLHYINI